VTGQLVFPFATSPLGRISRGKALLRPLAPRVSHAAVRVPDPRHTDLPLIFPAGHPQIFVHEGARQALERKLAQAHHRPVILSVTDNRRNMISHSQRGGILQARIHHMFLGASSEVQDALIRYVVKRERAASLIVSRFIEANGYRIRASRPVLTPLSTQGETHDLLVMFRVLNEKYFGNAVDSLITWGKRLSRRSKNPRRAIKLGSYSAVERLIRVHRVLDKPWVPRYFVSYIIYHEMLHHVIPSTLQSGGRRMLHPPGFVAREQMFRDYERALAWERAHIGRLLRS
jgi:hypothetical protein